MTDTTTTPETKTAKKLQIRTRVAAFEAGDIGVPWETVKKRLGLTKPDPVVAKAPPKTKSFKVRGHSYRVELDKSGDFGLFIGDETTPALVGMFEHEIMSIADGVEIPGGPSVEKKLESVLAALGGDPNTDVD